MSATSLDQDIHAYEQQLEQLLEHHRGKYVVFRSGKFIDAYDTFQNAASAAVNKFGLGPYLIRQVRSAQEIRPLPASVAYRPMYAAR
jgi:uncharacterized protein (DUF1330 family)